MMVGKDEFRVMKDDEEQCREPGSTWVTLRCQCHVTLANHNVTSVQKDKKILVSEREESHIQVSFYTLVTLWLANVT